MRLAIYLKRRGWDVDIISMLDRRHFDEELAREEIPVHCLEMRRGIPEPRGLLEAFSLMRRRSPSVVVTFMFHANTLGRIAAKLAGIPVIVTSIRNEQFGGRIADLAERFLAPLADVVTTNSQRAADALVERGVISTDRLEIIPNGLELTTFDIAPCDSDELRASLGVEPDDFLWLAVGHLRIQKDYRNLLRACAELVDAGRSNLQLRVAGHGPLMDELQARRELLGIEDHVQFLNYRDDIPALMHVADGFVLSSAWEGLPNAIMEAMASRLPVVATNAGGVSELLQDGVSGLMIPPHNSAALAEAMHQIMNLNEQHRRKMGDAGRQFVERRFDAERIFQLWETLFERLLVEAGQSVA